MANNTYTYVGSEIRPITGIEDKILSAKYIYDAEYEKYNQDLSISNLHDIIEDLQYIIDNLRGRIAALEESNVTKEYDLTVSLTGCSSTTLKNGKISENGGTYTVTADTHYNLPSSITVKQGSTTLTAGIHYIWSNGTLRILQGITGAISVTITATAKSYSITVSGNASSTQKSVTYTTSNVQVTLTPNTGYTITGATISGATFVSFSNNIVTFNKITGNITITAQTSEIVLTAVSVSKSTGTGTLSSDTVSLTGKGSSITLLLNSTPDTALNRTMSLAATNSGGATTNVLGLNTSTVSDGNTVKLTPTDAISGAKLKISNNKSTVLKTLTVNIADGSTSAISITSSDGSTASNLSYNGRTVELIATVTSTKFTVGEVKWTATGGSFKDDINTGNSVKFVAPANTSESVVATYEITATCDGISSTAYKVTVAKKPTSTEYYWYIGQENPASMANISPIVTDNESPGWRYLGKDLSVYNKNNMIFEGAVKHTITFTGRATAYIALPSSSIKLYDDTGYGEVLEDGWLNNPVIEKVINGVKYYIYTSNSSKLVAWGQDVY